MPRLSLYRPEKGNDFKFIDRAINEQFQVGGTDCMVHKYLGPIDPTAGDSTPGTPVNTNPIPELGIQDLILMENRDRHYDQDIYRLRGAYTMLDNVFNLAQFGLFLNNDEIMIHFHLRSTVEALGRKLMAGDVIELPHQKDEYALDDSMVALKRFYVISEVTRPSTGYSVTWYPHLLRAKCQPLVDSQEYKEILDAASGDGDRSLRDIISAYSKNIEINEAIIAQAEADAPKSGYDTRSFYVIPTRESGIVDTADASDNINTVDSETAALDASMILNSPNRDFYIGYLTGDGVPPNGAAFTQGIEFPTPGAIGQFHLRTDYFPNRLFRWNGKHWTKFEDNVRMTMTNKPKDGYPANRDQTRQTQKTGFINNNTTATIAGEVVPERQALSKALRPKADN
jgi:hypothetical protein